MLPMKFKTVEGLIRELSKSTIRRIVTIDVESIDDLDQITKSANLMLKTKKPFQVLLIGG